MSRCQSFLEYLILLRHLTLFICCFGQFHHFIHSISHFMIILLLIKGHFFRRAAYCLCVYVNFSFCSTKYSTFLGIRGEINWATCRCKGIKWHFPLPSLRTEGQWTISTQKAGNHKIFCPWSYLFHLTVRDILLNKPQSICTKFIYSKIPFWRLCIWNKCKNSRQKARSTKKRNFEGG